MKCDTESFDIEKKWAAAPSTSPAAIFMLMAKVDYLVKVSGEMFLLTLLIYIIIYTKL